MFSDNPMKVIKDPLSGKTIKVHEHIAGEVKLKSMFKDVYLFFYLFFSNSFSRLCVHLLKLLFRKRFTELLLQTVRTLHGIKKCVYLSSKI